MSQKKGNLSINSENIFPIIKKWLYQDHDIFYRELVSNGCDAITKLKKLSLAGEYEQPADEKYRIDVTVSQKEKTISFLDNGLGMTDEEVSKYINDIAFSGAADFLEKYKDKANEDQIIGHFGLGFYSAFMVADEVTIDTLSYQPGAAPVHWTSSDGMEFTMEEGTKDTRGTLIKLHINEDELQFTNEYKAREVLEKYCSFMPVEIYLHNADEVKKEEENKEGETSEKKEETPEKPLNETNPIWNENPSKVEKEQYLSLYRKVFRDFKEPLFWIHLNMDYPFNLKGILYFPKISNEYENMEGTIKLYNNQVFVADNIKEVIPEYLLLLKGVIDCPDLPLNVSRSALQNDGFVKKISDYITKKVSDKLSGMCKTEREEYEKYWDDISPFVKYGCLKDEKFGEKMKDFIIMKDLDSKYMSLSEYKEAKGETVYYITNEKEQSQYIRMFKKIEKDAVYMQYTIDSAFIGWAEQKFEGMKFVRIDADVSDVLKEEGEVKESEAKKNEQLQAFFKKTLKNDKLEIRVEKLKDDTIASVMTMTEENRRMQEMMKMYAAYGLGMGEGEENDVLILNSSNKLVKRLMKADALNDPSKLEKDIALQLYDMALLSCGALKDERMAAFIKRSQELMLKLQ